MNCNEHKGEVMELLPEDQGYWYNSAVRRIVGVSVLASVLSGCGNTDGYVIDAALKACKDHGGIHSMIADIKARHVECNDGVLVINVDRRP